MSKKLCIKYFASVREQLGVSEQAWTSESTNVGALRQELQAQNATYAAALDAQKGVRIALNHALCEDDSPLQDGDEVAFFPPVTGG